MSVNSKILIVDDDENIAELISLYLTKECYDTEIAHDGEKALIKFESFNPDLIILDLMLPGIDGYEVCREIRKTSKVPIIMLSAKGEVFDKVLGLELGADDYMMKPFDSKELVARVKAVLRRVVKEEPKKEEAKEDDEQVVRYEDLEINLTSYQFIYKGQELDFTPKIIELAYFLASHPNRVFNRDQLVDKVWHFDFAGDTRTVDVHMKRLREKLEDHEKWAFKTVYGIGYKFEKK
ncbi:MAG: response regulator transcription factor [Lachnospiraceae bacterium]|nr:response regulator transcription factor [Lachnospiraceae bacterium]